MMGSQTWDIFRQGIWASLTGGWFYDPQQNVFCNVLHLYIWLFFLCAPFLTHLYFPKTFFIWGTYSIITTCIMVILKGINMVLHMLYDRNEIMSDSCLKSSDSECPGIELQVLSKDGASPSGIRKTLNEHCSRKSQSSANGRKESMMDLEMEVHRKNSAASNVNVYENFEPSNEKHKKQTCESISNHLKDNCDCTADNELEVTPTFSAPRGENMSLSPVCTNSFEEIADKNQTQSTRNLHFFNYAHITPEQSSQNEVSEVEDVKQQTFRSPKLQIHNCEPDVKRRSHRSASENSFHDRRRVTQNASYLHSGDIYLKSDSGIESVEHHVNKFGRVSRKQMRKKLNNTMSTLQLSEEIANSSHVDKRRDSNTGTNVLNKTPGVRRAKSSALEISNVPQSISNVLPHPSSSDVILDEKRLESEILLPYNQSFTRNYLDFCHGTDLSLNIENNGTDQVHSTTDKIGKTNIGDYNKLIVRPPEENLNLVNKFYLDDRSIIDTECRDIRIPADSMSYDADVNGSCSPLLDASVNYSEKNSEELQSFRNVEYGSKYMNRVWKKSGDSRCPSDCEQVSAGSKDLLLTVNRNSNLKLASVQSSAENCFRDENASKSECSAIIEKELRSLGAIPKTPKQQEDVITVNNICKDFERQSSNRSSTATSSRSLSCESLSNEIYKPHKGQWFIVGRPKNANSPHNMLPIAYVCGDTVLSTHPKQIVIDSHYKLTPILKRSNATKRRKRIDDLLKDEGELSVTLDSENDDRTPVKNDSAFSITDFVQVQYDEQFSMQHFTRRNLLNIGRNEFNDSPYCDYWRSCDFAIDKSKPVKRCYKYRFKCFGDKELKIEMDRLQLLALFDRDLNWLHVIFATLLSLCVCSLGSLILNTGIYKDIGAFIFCLVIAGSQYSLLKSVQPDAASPVHGFNKTVAYSRPIYFCLFCSLLLVLQFLNNEIVRNENWEQLKSFHLFGMPVVSEMSFKTLLNTISTILLLFPILFSFGLFPQFDTFCVYALEQFDMHVFGGNAVCNFMASMFGVAKSIIVVCILYGPIYGALAEKRGTQHILFSIFCAGLVSLSYHLSRCASDFSHIWSLIKSSLFSYAEEENTSDNIVYQSDGEIEKKLESENDESNKTNEPTCKSDTKSSSLSIDDSLADPLEKKLQNTINNRLKNDLLVCSCLGLLIFGLHCTTVFTALQPDLNGVLFSIACTLGFILHYLLPQMRKHLPWLCFAQPILKPNEYGRFEVSEAPRIMWFEQIYVYLCFLEKNVLYPLIFISVLTADSHKIVSKFGLTFGSVVIAICALKAVRAAYSDCANQYLIVAFCVLLFKFDFNFASETFLLDYFVLSIVHRKICDFLLKMQFILTYIAPWQITWGSAFHAFAQPFSVPHSAMLFLQAVISAFLSTPLNPFLGSAVFLTSYVRPIKFWERDYNTKRIDHSNIRLSTQLEKDLGADDNNLNSIFYEHLTRSLQHSLCGDLLLGRWGNVNQGDCFVLASDYLNCLVHIIELGNGLCTFQIRGLEFRGTYCQQREVEAISEGIEDNDGCCCCSLGHLPNILSPNAIFSTRWLAWQVVAAQYVLEGYSISENLATATLQLFEFRKVLITYYIKSIIYYVIQNAKLEEWLESVPIKDALDSTLNRQFVDLDPVFNYNLDEDFDFRALGITRSSFCSVYLNWIQFCYSKRVAAKPTDGKLSDEQNSEKQNCSAIIQNNVSSIENSHKDSEKSANGNQFSAVQEKKRQIEKSVNKDSLLVSLCLALGLLARRSLATACHGSLSSVEFFLHGLHALFKGDFRITSPRDEWVFADMDLLHSVVAPAVKMGLKLHQDHFSSPDEYLDPAILYDAIRTHTKELVISHEADPQWRNAVLRGAPNLLALRHIMEDGSDEYRIIRLTKRFLSFRVIKLNRECVRGLWAGQQQELIYLRNRNPERGSIQNAKQALRNIINSSCDQPIGYPIFVSSLTTSYAETNQQICSLIGGSISIGYIQCLLMRYWQRVKQRCHEGCSSGNSVLDSDVTYEVPGTYFLSNSAGNASSLNFGVQSFNSSNRSTLMNSGKPSSSHILTGFLNREKDMDSDSTRDRPCKKNITLLLNEKVQFENIGKFPSALTTEEISTKNSADNSCKTNSCHDNLRASSKFSDYSPQKNVETPRTSSNLSIFRPNSHQSLVEINKKVIIVDGMEIYDCLDLGRRIDVIWPHESMRSNGGRSSWKDWSPKEGMVGFVVHYWQPNHPDQRFRSNVNRTLYLIAIGDRFVPIGERGIEECKENSLDFGASKQQSICLSDTDIYLGSAAQIQEENDNDCDVHEFIRAHNSSVCDSSEDGVSKEEQLRTE